MDSRQAQETHATPAVIAPAAVPRRRRQRPTRPMAMAVNWVVKASKLCNLRCRYCYEWEELAKRDRMSFEVWERLLLSARDYHDSQTAKLGKSFETRIIWHGGEPTLLPLSYFERVLALQHEILGSDRLRAGRFQNSLQTNLLTISDEKLDFFVRHDIHLGVSLDVIGGVRLDAGGRETEDRVVENLDRLRDRGIDVGAIAVLAGHTHRHIVAIYNFFESQGIDVRVLPVFDAPLNTPDASFALTADRAATALCRLFRHWIRRADRVLVYPLADYTYAVHQQMMGREQPRYDRRVSEWALLVNTDGTVYQILDAYDPALAHGNVLHESVQSMMDSSRYAASIERDGRLYERHCGPCEFRRACTSLPLFEAKRSDHGSARCAIGYRVMEHIESYFRVNEVAPGDILAFLA